MTVSCHGIDCYAAEAEKKDVFALSLKDLLSIRVASASRFSESLEQTPVPVSVITEEMIQSSGARSLRDLLGLYVPGFTQVQDQNEYNIAFRGIYTSSQQKILILLDGERLNSYAYSSASPDLAISLDKLKQIEIIRGPGSSVYGNVALTAVINLVLKSAKDSSGVLTKLKIGNHGLRTLYNEWSRVHNEIDFLAWAHYAETQGEALTIEPEDDYSALPANLPVVTRLDGFNDRPAVDVGLAVKANSWASRVNYRRAHYREPFSSAGVSGEAYDYDDYPQFDRVGPGVESSWLHWNAQKSVSVNEKNQLTFAGHYDHNRIAAPLVINPSIRQIADVSWQEKSMGASVEWARQMAASNLIIGMQAESMEVTESNFTTFTDGVMTGTPLQVLALGNESIVSAYGQYKQTIAQRWLLNIGGRYDVKHRYQDGTNTEFSPRIAFIHNQERFNLKLSYARSFVDPPFWNRFSALPSFRGSRDLQPEILESFQITPEFLFMDKQLSAKLNFYYNQHTDFVFRNNAAAADQPIYTNAGNMETAGMEHEWLYQSGQQSFRLIASYYQVEKVEFYEALDDEIFNIPQSQYSFIWDSHLNDALSIQMSAQYLGARLSPINVNLNGVPLVDPFPNQGVDFQDAGFRLPAVSLFNASVNWQTPLKSLEIALHVQNLFDKDWQQGGSTIHPYQQTGRWIQMSLGYHW